MRSTFVGNEKIYFILHSRKKFSPETAFRIIVLCIILQTSGISHMFPTFSDKFENSVFELSIFMNDMILIMIIIVSNGKFIFHLGEPSSSSLSSNNGTNCCSFLALKISGKWHLEIKSMGSDRKCFLIL